MVYCSVFSVVQKCIRFYGTRVFKSLLVLVFPFKRCHGNITSLTQIPFLPRLRTYSLLRPTTQVYIIKSHDGVSTYNSIETWQFTQCSGILRGR